MTAKKKTQNIAGLILERFQSFRDRPILITEEGEPVTRGQFMALVQQRQKQIKDHVTPEDRVLIASGRGITFWVDLVAVWGLGGITVPIDPNAHPQKNLQLAATAKSKIVLSDIDIDNSGDLVRIPWHDSKTMESGSDKWHAEPVSDESLAAILFTSGSTGKSKGVMLTHQALGGNSLATLAALKPSGENRLLINVPFHFTSAICHFLAACLANFTLVATEQKLLPADMLNILLERKATCFGGAPIQLRWIAEILDQSPGLPNFRLDWVMSSGDHLPVNVINLLQKRLPETRIYTVYGLTELGGRFCILAADLVKEHAGSVGTPINGCGYDIVDPESGRAQPAGQPGEILARGEYLFKGYFNDAAETAKALSEQGFRTGDIGYQDSSGLLHIQGRMDDVFKVNGQKVSGIVISDALMGLGVFEDVAVCCEDLKLLGPVAVVYYCLKEGNFFKRSEVIRDLRQKLPSNHIPQKFVECKAIPRTGSGKIIREQLPGADS